MDNKGENGLTNKCNCNKSIFEKQKEFMVACDQSIEPLDPIVEENFKNYNEWYLWMKLINEEHAELIEAALRFNDWSGPNTDMDVALVSEAIDLIYVTCGLLNNMGVDGQAVFDAIHNANMAKVGPDGKVVKNKDGKVLKPEGWTKADIKEIMYVS